MISVCAAKLASQSSCSISCSWWFGILLSIKDVNVAYRALAKPGQQYGIWYVILLHKFYKQESGDQRSAIVSWMFSSNSFLNRNVKVFPCEGKLEPTRVQLTIIFTKTSSFEHVRSVGTCVRRPFMSTRLLTLKYHEQGKILYRSTAVHHHNNSLLASL